MVKCDTAHAPCELRPRGLT